MYGALRHLNPSFGIEGNIKEVTGAAWFPHNLHIEIWLSFSTDDWKCQGTGIFSSLLVFC